MVFLGVDGLTEAVPSAREGDGTPVAQRNGRDGDRLRSVQLSNRILPNALKGLSAAHGLPSIHSPQNEETE